MKVHDRSPYLAYSNSEPELPSFDHLAERAARLSDASFNHDEGPSGALAPFGIALGATVWFIGFLVLHFTTGHL